MSGTSSRPAESITDTERPASRGEPTDLENVEMIRLPDLLHLTPRLSVDRKNLSELLDLAFLGKDTGNRIDQTLSLGLEEAQGWDPRL